MKPFLWNLEWEEGQLDVCRDERRAKQYANLGCTVTPLYSNPAPEWQPIEVAPTDGTPILAYIPDPWHSEHPPVIAIIQYKQMYGRDFTWVLEAYEAYSFEPSHWMPLPQPPVITDENKI